MIKAVSNPVAINSHKRNLIVMLVIPIAWIAGWEPNRLSVADSVIGRDSLLLKLNCSDLRS
jgi:hypothetical protein